jgi:hypothetical protein
MSIEGLRLFRDRFAPYAQSYVLIGGSACDLLFSEQGRRFRATHDLDIVVLADEPVVGFAKELWRFIDDGGYLCGWRNNPDVHYYRFTEPENLGFPKMIELFARHPGFPLYDETSDIVPLPADGDISSLSAILLDDAYYNFLKSGLTNIAGVNVPEVAHLIPLKARAHIDLNDRKETGQHVNTADLTKHKKDVINLASLMPIDAHVELDIQLKEDMRRFIDAVYEEESQNNQQQTEPKLQEILDLLKSTYGL